MGGEGLASGRALFGRLPTGTGRDLGEGGIEELVEDRGEWGCIAIPTALGAESIDAMAPGGRGLEEGLVLDEPADDDEKGWRRELIRKPDSVGEDTFAAEATSCNPPSAVKAGPRRMVVVS